MTAFKSAGRVGAPDQNRQQIVQPAVKKTATFMQHETGVDLPHSAAHNENGQSAAVFLPHDIRARQEQLERLREQASGGQSTTMAEGD